MCLPVARRRTHLLLPRQQSGFRQGDVHVATQNASDECVTTTIRFNHAIHKGHQWCVAADFDSIGQCEGAASVDGAASFVSMPSWMHEICCCHFEESCCVGMGGVIFQLLASSESCMKLVFIRMLLVASRGESRLNSGSKP